MHVQCFDQGLRQSRDIEPWKIRGMLVSGAVPEPTRAFATQKIEPWKLQFPITGRRPHALDMQRALLLVVARRPQ